MTRLKQLSSDESAAIEWWVQFITEAEVTTHNPKAVRNPHGYAHALAVKLWRADEVLPAIVNEWKSAACGGWLNEPLWPGTPRHHINKVLEAAA